MKNLMVVAMIFAGAALADDFVEFRSASRREYRYADWAHMFANKVVTDLYYIGVPGYNEFSACLGYTLPSVKGLTATPSLCGTVVKEDAAGGVKPAVFLVFEKGRLKGDAYYAKFQPLRGNAGSYDVLDAGNLVWGFRKKLNSQSPTRRWEAGISTGFFRQDQSWNPQYGPVIRRNDRLGFWAVSLRTGSANELRVIRTFFFTKP